jgi:uncharacterized protein YjdB
MRNLRFLSTLVLLTLFGVIWGCGSSSSSPSAPTGVSIGLNPPSLSLAAGTSAAVKATLTLSNMMTQDVTSVATWSSSDATIATVSRSGTVAGVTAGTVTVTAAMTAQGKTLSKTLQVTVTAAQLLSIALTPPNPTLAAGTTKQLTATGTFSDSTTQDLTAQATWSSSATSQATVGNGPTNQGLVTAVAVGTSTVTATLGAVTGTTQVAVTAAQLTSIAVTPPSPTVPKGITKQLAATGTFSDGTTQDLTSQVMWTSATTSTATVNSAGLITTVAAGTSVIGAALDGVAGMTTVTVSSAQLVSIGVTPAAPSVALGLKQQFKATGVYSDTTTQDLTTQALWSSATAATATVSNASGFQGLATSAAVGTTSITAALGGVTSPGVTLTVTPATLVSIAVTPPAPSIAKGLAQQFVAMGTYTDTTAQDLSTLVTWSSDTAATASISNATGSQGLATSAGVGTASITATLGGVTSPGVTLTVTAAALVSIAVTPPTPSIAKGLTEQFVAMGTYTDTTTQTITTTVTWASATAVTATISNAAGTQGLATSAAVGTTSITAALGGVTSPGVTLTVTPATLVSIAVTPPTPSIAKGLTQQFVAMGTYTDTTTQDLSTLVTWSSDTAATASISNAVGSQGLATSAAVGTASIAATLGGVMSPGVTLTVTPAQLVSIAVTPPTPSIAKGLTVQFIAMGTYTDTSAQDLTSQVTWSSDTAATASISNAVGSQGLATSVAVGTTSITATLGGVTSPGVTLTVTPATLVSIAVTPPTPSIAKGLTVQFVAMGTYTDTTTQTLTTTATWSSATAATATVSNAPGTQGLATSAAVGTTSITATLGGVMSPGVTLTVTPATLVSVAVTPPTPSIAKGLTVQFVAMGTYTDTTTQTLTTTATWSSATAATATISNAAGTRGLATSVAVGTTSITATLGGVTSPGVTLTVTPATLVSIAVTPPTPSIAKGLTVQFVAMGTYTDTTTQTLTTTATWSSATAATATISNAAGTRGLATSAAVGTTSVTATFGGVTSPGVTLTVTAATLVSIAVTPASPSTQINGTQQFVATGTYTDTTTQTLTTTATWTSATMATATISNAAGTQGLATGIAVGTTSITATFGGVTSPGDTLTVSLLPSQCTTATIINDPTRNVTAGSPNFMCDTALFSATPQWVRFEGTGGTIIASSPPAVNECDTQTTGWVSSSAYPTTIGATSTATVCYNWSGNSCAFSNSIQICNCNGYYVYDLIAPNVCNARYCTQ